MQLMQNSVFDFRGLPDALCNRTHDRMYAAFRRKRLNQILCMPGIAPGEPDILNADTAGEEIILEIGAVDLIVQRDLTQRGVIGKGLLFQPPDARSPDAFQLIAV